MTFGLFLDPPQSRGGDDRSIMLSLSLVTLTLLGLAVGSFLNVVIARLPAGKPLTGRSRCPRCRRTIAWFDNIPLVSFLLLGGRCRRCRQPISWQYPAVELATAALFVLAAAPHAAAGLGGYALAVLARDLVAISVLVVVFVIDLRHFLIFDVVTLPAAALALAVNLALGVPWPSLLLGGILGAGFFLLQYLLSRGRWIGGGDIRLGLLMGVLLGWERLVAALFVAYAAGAVVGVGLLATGRKTPSSPVPFGTFLSVGTIAALLYGNELITWYWKGLPHLLGRWLGI